VVLGVVRVVAEPEGATTRALVWSFSIATAAVICAVTIWFYSSRMSRAVASAPPGAWSSPCVLVDDPSGWRAVIADDAGLSIVDARGRTRRSWSWHQVVDVRQASLVTGLVHHDGLQLITTTEEEVGLLFPSRSTLAYPRHLLTAARTEIEHRIRARNSSHDVT
jgi:hypothetical protein